jgi:hypothetical protein
MRIWGRLLRAGAINEPGRLTIIYGRAPGGAINRSDGDTFRFDIAAVCQLQHLLITHLPKPGHSNAISIQSFEASTYGDEEYFQAGDVILLGGPGANNTTLRIFNHLPSIRYRIEYSAPHYQDIWIQDLLTGERYRASCLKQRGEIRVILDLAILTVIKNPYRSSGYIVGAMGIHGYGTFAAARLLSGEEDAGTLLEYINDIDDSDRIGFQVLIEAHEGGSIRMRDESYYSIPRLNTTAHQSSSEMEAPIH